MKIKFFLILFLMLVSSYMVSAQKLKEAVIEFPETIHNYDTIKKGKTVACFFYYKNTGNKPLVLYDVFSSCGCTVPFWNKQPLLPGAKGKIKVVFNAINLGHFQKTIVVKSNARNVPIKILKIKGYVKK